MTPRINFIQAAILVFVFCFSRPSFAAVYTLKGGVTQILFHHDVVISASSNRFEVYVSDCNWLIRMFGQYPYRDHMFEYPPYALIWLVIPSLGGSLENFQSLFIGQILLVDLAIKAGLLWEGCRCTLGLASLRPLILYSIGGAFLNFFYLQRLDVIPAGLSFAALWAFSRERFFLSGVALAVAAGTKLYPLLFILPLLTVAWRKSGSAGRQFVIGNFVGYLPLLLLGLMIPWWRFISFHTARGLEVESSWASVLWMLHFFRDSGVEWSWAKAWVEVSGPGAEILLPWARGIFLGAVACTTIWVSGILSKRGSFSISLAELARVSLIVLLPFVAFNIVLSPQYMIWLLILSAAGSSCGNQPALWLLVFAAALTPVWYPSPEFAHGLTLGQTSFLLFRNLILIVAWIALAREFQRQSVSGRDSDRTSTDSVAAVLDGPPTTQQSIRVSLEKEPLSSCS